MELGSFTGTCYHCSKLRYKWLQCWKLHSRPNQPPGASGGLQGKWFKKKRKVNCTKWNFWVQILGLVWLVVVVALLDRVVVLGCKELALLKVQAPLT